MSNIAFVLGNGESRKGIKIEDLKKHGKVYACNAVYRTETPDYLICVDPKMILELCETDYPAKNTVWSNFNNQYKKVEMAQNINYFKPSLGWSSGPTALKLAADNKHDEIYILGFDYQGVPKPEGRKGYAVNNIFKDTRNYKKGKEEATYYGNWMNQTKRILTDYPHIQFNRVIREDGFKPNDLTTNFYKNLNTTVKEEFTSKFKITLR